MSRLKNLLRNINYLLKHSLWDQREEDIVYLTNKILDDGIYEYGLNIPGYTKIQVLDQEGTLDLIEAKPKSFIRTGDGEIKLMMGMDQPFQRYEKEIAERLIKLLEECRDDLYVGINRNYFIPLSGRQNPAFYRRNAFDFRNFYRRHLNMKTQYIDAAFTSYPIGQKRTAEYDQFFERWKKLFRGKDIAIVCGNGILDKLEYDVFEEAKSKYIIKAPKKNAWDKYRQIIAQIKENVSISNVIVFILGMAGKAMIPELTDMGYMCWDVGHLAKYYNAYMTQLSGTAENIANFYAPD